MADQYTFTPPSLEEYQNERRKNAALAAAAAMLMASGGRNNTAQALGAGGMAALNARNNMPSYQDQVAAAMKMQELRAVGDRAARKAEREQKGQQAYDDFNPLTMLPAFGMPTIANAEALTNLQKDPLTIPLARASAALGAGGNYDDLARLLSTQLVNQRAAQNVSAQNWRHETPSGTSRNASQAAWDRTLANIDDRQLRHGTPSASAALTAGAANARTENFPYVVEGDEGPIITTRKNAVGRIPPKKQNQELPAARHDLEVWKANNPVDPLTGKRVPTKEPYVPQRASGGTIGGAPAKAPKIDPAIAEQVKDALRAGKDPAAMAKRMREAGFNPNDYGL